MSVGGLRFRGKENVRFLILGVGIDFGFGEILGIILMPVVVAAFLIWYAKHAESKGWIS